MQLYLGDCLDILRTLPDNSVDSVVTDPPYGLSFMGRKWDYDVPSVEIWAECLRSEHTSGARGIGFHIGPARSGAKRASGPQSRCNGE